MTRQEELNEAWCKHKHMNKCSTEIMQALAFALRWCEEHPQWISVENELPPIGGIVLVAIPLGGELRVLPLSIKNERDFEYLSGMTHWMPLPQPPKGGGRSAQSQLKDWMRL